MVEVFKTNVKTKKQASKILTLLSIQYPDAEINFDLSDCDKILRVEGANFTNEEVIDYLNKSSFECEVLE